MPGMRGTGSLLLAAALLVLLLAPDGLVGFSAQEAAGLLALGGIGLIMGAAIVEGFARHWTHGVEALAWSAGCLGVLLILYAFRGELGNTLDRAIGDISFGRTVVTAEGEVVAARRTDGSFVVKGLVNGQEARFIFDTGASTVVLRAESAAALGISLTSLDYTVPVATANGISLAAPVIIERLSIGSITERKIPALVTRAGTLPSNLLGMSFLERLASYEVRGNRLILRAKSQGAS